MNKENGEVVYIGSNNYLASIFTVGDSYKVISRGGYDFVIDDTGDNWFNNNIYFVTPNEWKRIERDNKLSVVINDR